MTKSTWLLDYKKDIYSQKGEDGIIEKILEIIPGLDSWCVEFGAWNGQHLSNTRHLIESKGYSAILIESDSKRFHELQKKYEKLDNVTTINKLVGFTKEDNLDHILRKTTIPVDFDLLSIDIDGNDYHAWKAIEHYQPKIVVIEFNPTIPTQVEFIQPADPQINQGSSLSSLVDLGKEKGYELVAVLPFNAFFVKNDLYDKFQITSNSPETLRTDSSAVTYLFSGYDGKIFLRGSCKLPWHKVLLKESNFQCLPRFLRTYPENFSKAQKKLHKLYQRFMKSC